MQYVQNKKGDTKELTTENSPYMTVPQRHGSREACALPCVQWGPLGSVRCKHEVVPSLLLVASCYS